MAAPNPRTRFSRSSFLGPTCPLLGAAEPTGRWANGEAPTARARQADCSSTGGSVALRHLWEACNPPVVSCRREPRALDLALCMKGDARTNATGLRVACPSRASGTRGPPLPVR